MEGATELLSANTAATGARIDESEDITTEVRILFSIRMNVLTALHAFKFQTGVIALVIGNGH